MHRDADEVRLRFARVAVSLDEASTNSGEFWPNTFVMSPFGAVEVFSSTVFAMLTSPTSQPARVNGTHGAGVVLAVPESPFTMFGSGSVLGLAGSTGSVRT